MNRWALQWVCFALRSATNWVETDEDPDVRSAYMLAASTRQMTSSWREFHAAMRFQHAVRTGFDSD
jgi:hypothetical protein